ncbi:MAG: nicotinamide-nucleotide amidohydrolase family protein, partial [Clostridia bacterium]|nr:nicotinamide-nucleotide amidohydrolase family protein [Clostridia bacterium]
ATLSCAESCTGGLLSSAFVDMGGSSAYFVEGDVTYANEAKMGSLGVKAETLDRFTAVSEECAREMAVGMRNKARTDYALATTGYAGPDGENVGLVYVSLAAPDGVKVKELHLTGDRNRIRRLAVLHALDMLRRKLCEK